MEEKLKVAIAAYIGAVNDALSYPTAAKRNKIEALGWDILAHIDDTKSIIGSNQPHPKAKSN